MHVRSTFSVLRIQYRAWHGVRSTEYRVGLRTEYGVHRGEVQSKWYRVRSTVEFEPSFRRCQVATQLTSHTTLLTQITE